MKRIINKFSILAIALLIGSLAMTGCTASERTAKNTSSGGTAQNGTAQSENKQAENKSAESKKVSQKEILWDFRKDDDSKPETFSKAETEAVVKYLFGDAGSSKIEIRNRLSGSFTKPNTKETLYYLSGCKDEENSSQFTTDCPHVSWDSVGWIAVFDGTTPILKISEALGNRIGKIIDVNGDGKNEFLSFSGYGQSGQVTQSAAIGQISDGKYESIKGFSGYADNCASGGGKADSELSARASVISFVPTADGKMPEFSEEFFRGQCKDSDLDKSSWKETNKKDFSEFFDSLS